MFDDQRRAPGRRLVARLTPALLTGFLVERDHEVRTLVVPVDHECVAVKRGRGPFAEGIPGLHLPEVLLPFEIAVEIVAVDPARAKRHIEMLAIGHRRRGGEAVVAVMPLVRHLLARDLLPEDLSGVAIHAEDDELVLLRGLLASHPAAT